MQDCKQDLWRGPLTHTSFCVGARMHPGASDELVRRITWLVPVRRRLHALVFHKTAVTFQTRERVDEPC